MSIYAIVWAYQQDSVGGNEKFTLVTAAQYANDDGVCWVKQETLAEDMGIGVSTVRRHLARLEDDYELIERIERRRKDGTRTSDLIRLIGYKKPDLTNKRSNRAAEGVSTAQNEQDQPLKMSGQETSVKETSLSNAFSNENAPGKPAQPDLDDPQGWEFEEYIRDGLEARGSVYSRSKVRRYTRQANALLRRGAEAETIYEGCDRVISEWDRITLTLDDAIRDQENGVEPGSAPGASAKGSRPSAKASATPEDVIAYVIENATSTDMSRYESTMRAFDFTTNEYPPFNIEKQLGGTENERWANLNRIQTLAKRARRNQKGA